MTFKTLFIKDYQNLQHFTMHFNNSSEEGLNINVLVGRNGSGKSNLIDALFQIGKYSNDTSRCPFDFWIEEDDDKKWGNIQEENIVTTNNKWNRVIRFYTGNTERSSKENKSDEKYISLDVNDCKWILLSLFLNADWEKERKEENSLWKKIESLVLGNNYKIKNTDSIEPEFFWVDTNISFEDEENKSLKDFFSDFNLTNPYFVIKKNDEKYRHIWKLDKNENNNENSTNSLTLTLEILKRVYEEGKEEKDFILYDTGFIFKKNKGEKETTDLFLSKRLSDGELGFLERFALIMLLKNQEKMLVLLDEPETHFNEYWKTYLIYLICEALKNEKHDIFIASHSAMLITDVKPEELHRLEIYGDKTVAYPPPINTYGVSVVDIGKSLFLMESDIGERSRVDIEEALKNGDKDKLENLLRVVGAGEWRWKIRHRIRELEKNETQNKKK